MNDLIIYHANCCDGAAAAWVAKQSIPTADLFYCQYYQDPPDVKGRNVFCVDFSFPRETLLKMHAEAASLTVLDHHKTSAQELEGLDFCIFDMSKAGCRMTWEWFNPGKEPPWLVAYIEDRDLWNWKLPRTQEINAAIESYKKRVESVEKLAAMSPDQLAAEGSAILRFRDIVVDDICKGARKITLEGHTVLCAYAPTLHSEVGEKLAERANFGVTWFDKEDGTICYSLRALKGSPVDLADIAKKYGGGGHPTASGFRSKLRPHELR